MIILLLLCAIIGLFITGVTGSIYIGLFAALAVFICGLPVTFIVGCVHDEVEYAQDRADLRQLEAELAAEERAERHELMEDSRTDRMAGTVGNVNPVINDNRQLHIHNQVLTSPFWEGNNGNAVKEKLWHV
jgi:hypothetical protein